jgi:hypothetical protein
MSETAFPVGSGGDGGTGGSKLGLGRNRAAFAVIGLGLVLAVGAVVWLTMFSGSGESNAEPIAKATRKPRPTASPTETTAPAVIPAAFDGSVGRNPFKPLVFAPEAAASAPGVPVVPPPTDPFPLPTTWPTAWPIPNPTPTATQTPSSSPTPTPTPTQPRQHYVVALTEADPDAGTATFVVNQQRYDVTVTGHAQPFGPTPTKFSLLSVRHDADWGLEQTYATILFGDERFIIEVGTYLQFS